MTRKRCITPLNGRGSPGVERRRGFFMAVELECNAESNLGRGPFDRDHFGNLNPRTHARGLPSRLRSSVDLATACSVLTHDGTAREHKPSQKGFVAIKRSVRLAPPVKVGITI